MICNTYNSFPTEDICIKTDVRLTNIQTTLNQDILLQCTRVIYNKLNNLCNTNLKLKDPIILYNFFSITVCKFKFGFAFGT